MTNCPTGWWRPGVIVDELGGLHIAVKAQSIGYQKVDGECMALITIDQESKKILPIPWLIQIDADGYEAAALEQRARFGDGFGEAAFGHVLEVDIQFGRNQANPFWSLDSHPKELLGEADDIH